MLYIQHIKLMIPQVVAISFLCSFSLVSFVSISLLQADDITLSSELCSLHINTINDQLIFKSLMLMYVFVY